MLMGEKKDLIIGSSETFTLYPTLNVLVFQNDVRDFLASRAISHRQSADQYALHEQTLDWSTECSK